MKRALKFFFRNQYFDCPTPVYYPSEDSYFLAENVSVRKGENALDMGCGSGIQSLNMLFAGAGTVTCVDTNSGALETTKKNCENAGFAGKIKCIQSDLFENFGGKASMVVFNPPYVVSEGIKYQDLDGGKRGREVLDRFLTELPSHLEKNAKCFFVQTNLNGYRETREKAEKLGLKAGIIAKKRGFFEELAVFECKN